MITQKNIESAYENIRNAEESMFQATEEEIQARMMLESLKAIKEQFRALDYNEEWDKREGAWKQAEHDKRVAVHMHRMAKLEIQMNKDLLDFMNLQEFGLPDHYSEATGYSDSDIAVRNLKAVKVPKKKTIY